MTSAESRVHIAARVLGQARAGEIVCSRTVKDLVAGAGFAFTDANHCTESRSHRTWSRRQQLNQDSDRSIFHRWSPSRADDSIPRRAIRGVIPRRRSQARLARLS